MVIERVTGSKPQEIKQAEKSARTRDVKDVDVKKADSSGSEPQVTAEVSEQSKAAIKAYRLAAESSPDISRASRMAQIKEAIASGSYRAPSDGVAAAIVSSIAKGV